MLTLHYLSGTCSFVPHVALEWSGLPYEAKGETRTSIKEAAYLKLNPMGQVPLLVDGDWTLTQNVAIVSYIHDLAPNAGIFGKGDAHSIAKARQWLAFANADVHRQFGQIFGAASLLSNEDSQQELVQKSRDNILKQYSLVDEVVTKQDYLAGDISVADLYIYITSRWADNLGIDLSSLPHFADYRARIESNPAVKKVMQIHELS